MLRALLVLLTLAACADDDGPTSPHCVEVRMRWLELDYRRRMDVDNNDFDAAAKRAHTQDLIVSADLKCFAGV